MPRLVERNTGSVVNVPDEKVANVLALGYYELEKGDQETATKKAAAKKSSK